MVTLNGVIILTATRKSKTKNKKQKKKRGGVTLAFP